MCSISHLHSIRIMQMPTGKTAPFFRREILVTYQEFKLHISSLISNWGLLSILLKFLWDSEGNNILKNPITILST